MITRKQDDEIGRRLQGAQPHLKATFVSPVVRRDGPPSKEESDAAKAAGAVMFYDPRTGRYF